METILRHPLGVRGGGHFLLLRKAVLKDELVATPLADQEMQIPEPQKKFWIDLM